MTQRTFTKPPRISSKQATAFLDDPDLLEKSAIFYEEHNRQRWLSRRTTNRKTGAKQGVKTRRYNQAVQKTAEELLAIEKSAEINFLPFEIQDSSRKLSVTDLMTLTRTYSDPKQIEIINRLYLERLCLT